MTAAAARARRDGQGELRRSAYRAPGRVGWCACGAALLLVAATATAQDSSAFHYKVETYCAREDGAQAFVVRLEQPFLAEEFERSNYLRARPLTDSVYLVYPRQTRFVQRHAVFYGRLRGAAPAKLRIDCETVSEGPDGAREVRVHETEITIAMPAQAGGAESIFSEWASQQTDHFLERLRFYPGDSFLQYVLMQSPQRYGISAAPLPGPAPERAALEHDLYSILGGGLGLQEALQRQAFASDPKPQARDIHIRELTPPTTRWTDYAALLEARKAPVAPRLPALAHAVPEDQYIAAFASLASAGELFDLTQDWGTSLLRLATARARDERTAARLEEQLGLSRAALTELCENGTITEIAITGVDSPVAEGADFSLVLRIARAAEFDEALARAAREADARGGGLESREFRYRGQPVVARYTADRRRSSFIARIGDIALLSNSHVAIRRLIETGLGQRPRLSDAPDLQYVSTILPPAPGRSAGYFYASQAYLRRLIAPEARIAESRRRHCYNNLVMLNHAALFFRLENDRRPESLSELIGGKYISGERLTCPHGGAYAYDPGEGVAACSLHNRLSFLTPTAELEVLQVSAAERDEYNRFKERSAELWRGGFQPVALRCEVGARIRIESCIAPLPTGGIYADLRAGFPLPAVALEPASVTPDVLGSLALAPGRERIGAWVRALPGVNDVLADDPTLTDLKWLGDRITLHLCDGESIVEVDPTQLRAVKLLIDVPVELQLQAAAAIAATSLPAYASIAVDDTDKAQRLLDQLTSRILLRGRPWMGLESSFDAYRLPDYRGHAQYVLGLRLYALKVRLHVALIGRELIAATTAGALRAVIDAAGAPAAAAGISGAAPAHASLTLNVEHVRRLRESLRLHWQEKSRLACHANIVPLETLARLRHDDLTGLMEEAQQLSGLGYYCPEGGTYEWDAGRDELRCGTHGNRRDARQPTRENADSPFERIFGRIARVRASLRFQDDALLTEIEITRAAAAAPAAAPAAE